ncbi:hypothetical protein D3C73_1089120 [compost metagenome]
MNRLHFLLIRHRRLDDLGQDCIQLGIQLFVNRIHLHRHVHFVTVFDDLRFNIILHSRTVDSFFQIKKGHARFHRKFHAVLRCEELDDRAARIHLRVLSVGVDFA